MIPKIFITFSDLNGLGWLICIKPKINLVSGLKFLFLREKEGNSVYWYSFLDILSAQTVKINF
jgi:hypothetical protein